MLEIVESHISSPKGLARGHKLMLEVVRSESS